jgi:hypothetical protein
MLRGRKGIISGPTYLCLNLSDSVCLGWPTDMKIPDIRLHRLVYLAVAPK